MTGPVSSKSNLFLGFDACKNQEWLRRRKLRIEQVRKQSSDIAKVLRQKAILEEKAKAEELARIKEAKWRSWKAERLEELERKLKIAIEEFGNGHKLAEEESHSEEVLEMKKKINFLKAQERGEVAKQQELTNRKIAEEKKMSPIARKKMTRKLEDLRSALVRSLAAEKKLMSFEDQENEFEKENSIATSSKKEITLMKKKVYSPSSHPSLKDHVCRKVISKKMRKKKPVTESFIKQCKCNHKQHNHNIKGKSETIWINLNELQSSSIADSGLKYGSCKTESSEKVCKGTTDKVVEVYDFPSRYYSRSFKDDLNLVEKIDSEFEPNANELSKMEEEIKEKEAQKKHETDLITQERGIKALRKEKMKKDYKNLIAKLDELSKKEKLIKTQQRIPSSILYMNDERLLERAKAKQRIMNSKLESIFLEASNFNSQINANSYDPREVYDRSGGGDYADSSERIPTKLSFSPSNLKTNTPVTPSSRSPYQTSPEERIPVRRKEKKTKKKNLLRDIDRTLKEGRKLRRKISRNWEEFESKSSFEENSDIKKEKSDAEQAIKNVEPEKVSVNSKIEELDKVVKSQDRESQTENLRNTEEVTDAKIGTDTLDDNGLYDSLPLSTSTTYKSPPRIMPSNRLLQFLDYLEGLSETKDNYFPESSINLKKNIKTILRDLMCDDNSLNLDEEVKESSTNSKLEYYIVKLLNMTRERIADLSVSSENISTPNITDLDVKSDPEVDAESNCCCSVLSKEEELIRKHKLKRAITLEEAIKNWKTILEANLNEKPLKAVESVDEPDIPCLSHLSDNLISDLEPKQESNPDFVVLFSPQKSKYDQITQKCSERITELSNMLNKVRKDKEKLLSSASATSSLSLGKDDKNSFFTQKEYPEMAPRHEIMNSKRSLFIESLIDRFNSSKTSEPVAESFRGESLASSESLPDVMDELLRRKILTSPFKWSERIPTKESGATQDKPSSIETVIGNFRKEMSKIKPFSMTKNLEKQQRSPQSFSSEKKCSTFCSSPRKSSARKRLFADFQLEKINIDSNSCSNQEESSVESLNHALSNLGLNWAKNFLKKNEESRAISSSSDSEQENSFRN